MVGKIIGIIVVLAIAILLAVFTCKSKKSDLFKWVGIFIFIAFALTWVIPYGTISSGVYSDYQMQRLGFGDIPTILYYALNFCVTTILYLFVVAGFYGVLSKTKAYKAMVSGLAKKIKGKEVITTIITIVLLAVITAFAKSTLIAFIFVPFIVSILLNAKFDRVTTMGVTFGSILVGVLGAIYGTDGLYYFNYYTSTEVKTGITYRAIIFAIALVGFVIYNIIRVNKVVKKNKTVDAEADLLLEEASSNTGKAKIKKWPTIVVFAILAFLVIVGGIDWSTNFGITWFTDFHTWLTGLTIGSDFTLFGYLLGSSAVALGSFETSTFIIIMLIATVIVALTNKLSGEEFVEGYGEGFKKMLKPIVLYVLTYVIFVTCYMTPIVPWIVGNLSGETFNPYLTTLSGIIASIFHADLGYTGYSLGSIVTTLYADNIDIAHTLYIVTYGLVQLFAPVGGFLLVGLGYLNIDYKKWFKYIWIYALALLVVILIIATVATYWI